MGISAIKTFLFLTVDEKLVYVRSQLKEKLEWFDLKIDNDLPILVHKKTQLEFVFVPGGYYERGFSLDNQKAAEKISRIVNANYSEMRPVSEKKVDSFLVTRTPILYSDIHVNSKRFPYICDYVNAQKYAKDFNMRLLTENEWEYCARAGDSTLFPFGDELLDNQELEKWLMVDFTKLDCCIPNKLGVYGLFVGEWTSDFFTIDYSQNSIRKNHRVVRGGGSFFWPWQDQEWVWCMSAMRMPDSDLYDGECAFRLVIDL